jgi:hypothetical protein
MTQQNPNQALNRKRGVRAKGETTMQHGDLIFSFIGHPRNAISDVTSGYRGARVNHMGMILENHRGVFVLEAFYPEVRLTSLRVFLRRSRFNTLGPRYMVGRIRDQELVPAAIDYGLEQRAIPYDHLYLTDEDALYCSELMVDMLRSANGGDEYFPETPMSFRDTQTGELHETWISYYRRFGMNVPEHEPGSNPGDISLDDKVEIYDVQGQIPGYSQP